MTLEITIFSLKIMAKSGLEIFSCAPIELLLTGLAQPAFLADFLALGSSNGGLGKKFKPIYEVCDFKSEKFAPMYCFEETPL